MRIIVACIALLAAIAVGCGSDGDARARGDVSANREPKKASGAPSNSAAQPTLKVTVESGDRLLELFRKPGREACFQAVFSHGYGEEPWVQGGEAGCIGQRPWFVLVGAGGHAGVVDWVLTAGATRANVERVVIRTKAGGEQEATLRPSQEQGWKTFGHEFEEPIASISAYGEDGLIGELTIPTLVGSECDWVCKADGPWGVEFDSLDPLHPRELERHPDLAVISRDAQAREILEGQPLDIFGPKPWKDCAGLERGRAWQFIVERGPPIRRRTWPTLNSAGEKVTVQSTAPADVVVVDLDHERAEVVSILPFDLNTWPLVRAGIDEVPFATEIDNEEPMKSKGCRILF